MTTPNTERSQNRNRSNPKWTIRQHWQRASIAKRVRWCFEALGGLIALGVLVNYVWQNLQTRWNFQAEHSPLLIHSRPPELLQPFICDPEAHTFSTGNMRIYVKNIGNANAKDVFPFAFQTQVVPVKKAGVPGLENPPVITPESCQATTSKNDLMFDVAQGREFESDMRQSGGTISPKIASGDIVNFDMALCATYVDDYGKHRGTCDNYILHVPSTRPIDSIFGTTEIVCDKRPVMGTFTLATTGRCQN